MTLRWSGGDADAGQVGGFPRRVSHRGGHVFWIAESSAWARDDSMRWRSCRDDLGLMFMAREA